MNTDRSAGSPRSSRPRMMYELACLCGESYDVEARPHIEGGALEECECPHCGAGWESTRIVRTYIDKPLRETPLRVVEEIAA